MRKNCKIKVKRKGENGRKFTGAKYKKIIYWGNRYAVRSFKKRRKTDECN